MYEKERWMTEIGCGLYGPALLFDEDLESSIESIGKCGFTAVEPFIPLDGQEKESFPRRAVSAVWPVAQIWEMKPQLDVAGLALSSAHIAFMDRAPEDCTDNLLRISEETGICHFVTSMMADTKEKGDYAADQLMKANSVMNPEGVFLHYHNHKMESCLIATEYGEIPVLEYMIRKSGITVQLDTGWYVYGGGNVLEFIDHYADSIASVHLKDFVSNFDQIEKNDAFCAIGKGINPTAEIIERLPGLNLIRHGLMIDQDYPEVGHGLLEDLAAGIEYVKRCLSN